MSIISKAQLDSLIELLKSAGRFVWFGLLGLIVTVLGALALTPQVIAITVNIAGQQISIGFILIAVIGFIAKGIDLYIKKNQNIKSNGIAPAFLQK